MRTSFDLQSAGAIHRIIQDAAGAVDKARKDDPTALQEISDSTDGDPFRVLIATVLSHRTKDPVTALASSRLFARFPNVKSLAAANTRTVARLIKPVGFYNTKARTVKKISRILLDKYAGKVPENMDQLLELPSVGRKTANCVFVYGFKTPAIPVDTHVHRIFNRIGVASGKSLGSCSTSMVARFLRIWISCLSYLRLGGRPLTVSSSMGSRHRLSQSILMFIGFSTGLEWLTRRLLRRLRRS
ncbi:endonuclease III [Candidatus Bathyarchaeota archaeon]|nr:MAG: endonuclease III [Candidatus Bathyarchaeota archaeon]